MYYIIIEDEEPAARRLQKLLEDVQPEAELAAHLDSVEDAVKWFKKNEAPDLVFMDIQLGDGQSLRFSNRYVLMLQ